MHIYIYMIIMIIYARLIGAGFVLEDPALPSECSAASTCRHCPTGSSILGAPWGFEQPSSNWPSSIQCLRPKDAEESPPIYGGEMVPTTELCSAVAWAESLFEYTCRLRAVPRSSDHWKIASVPLYVYLGLSENEVYSQSNSHLIGIMIINHWV